jgi:hypothetical protein
LPDDSNGKRAAADLALNVGVQHQKEPSHE